MDYQMTGRELPVIEVKPEDYFVIFDVKTLPDDGPQVDLGRAYPRAGSRPLLVARIDGRLFAVDGGDLIGVARGLAAERQRAAS